MSVHSATETQPRETGSRPADRSPSPWLFRGAVTLALLAIPIFVIQVAWGQLLVTPWYLPILGTLSAIAVVYSLKQTIRWWRVCSALFCVGIAALEWFFVLGMTVLPAYAGPLHKGSNFPPFRAQLANGTVSDESLFKESPATVMIFFQGRWCPFCMTQLKELEAHHQDFARIGAKVVVVSLEDQTMAEMTQRQFPHLVVLSDESRELSNAVELINRGIAPGGKDSDVPTMIVVDKSGTVKWLHRPKRFISRPSSTELVTMIERQTWE